MPRIFVTAITIWAVGCIIPAPLEAEPTQGQRAPIIVAGEPPFGEITEPKNPLAKWRLTVTATDENADDKLYAGFYWKNGDRLSRLVGDPLELAPTMSNQRAVSTPLIQYCSYWSGSAAAQTIWVYVQDTPIPSDDPLDLKNLTGRFDSQWWAVTCQ